MFGILIVDGEFFFGVIATPIKILFKTWYDYDKTKYLHDNKIVN